MHHVFSKPLAKFAAATLTFLVCRELSQAQAVVTSGQAESPQQRRGFGAPERGVYKARITPHWLTNNVQFWYRNDLRGGAKEFILVDAEKGIRERAFDHEKLATALAKAAGEEVKAGELPFSQIEFIENGNAVTFEAFAKSWRCVLDTFHCVSAATNSTSALSTPSSPGEPHSESPFAEPASPQDQTNQPPARERGSRRRGEREV